MKLTLHSGHAGCAAKQGPQVLTSILDQIDASQRDDAAIGESLGTRPDAGAYGFDDHQLLLHNVDFITPMVDDPVEFGRIAAANALSDIYAMGGTPLSVMNIFICKSPMFWQDAPGRGEIASSGYCFLTV
jgi:selenide,water dikinase